MKIFRPALIAGLCLWSAAARSDHDPRQIVFLDEPDRHAVLDQMHFFMNGVTAITSALARKDMNTVAAEARARGRRMPDRLAPEVRAKLPANFLEIGKTVHFAFDDLAADAEGFGDVQQSLEQLAGVLALCNACHVTYQIRSSTYDPILHMK